jgi:alkaline phosphatase D
MAAMEQKSLGILWGYHQWLGLLLCLAFFPFMAMNAEAAATLTHGPIVGGVTANDAKVLIRSNKAASVKIFYGTDPSLATGLFTQSVSTSLSQDFSRIIPLSDLEPKTIYYLNVFVDDIPQFTPPYPLFATFSPKNTPTDFKFIVLSDFLNAREKISLPDSPTFFYASQEGAQFAFIGGDFDHRNPTTLQQKAQMFKDLYSENYEKELVNGIFRTMPMVHQWDDHDAGWNNCDKTYWFWAWSKRVFAAAVPSYNLPAGFGIWQSFSYGNVDFFVLDCRSQRDPDWKRDNMNKSMLDGRHLGSAGQLEWLKMGLLNSTARWKIIFSSVVTNPTTKHDDGWAAFQTEWGNLRKFIEDNQIYDVVFISGDLHMGAIDNGRAAGFPEMSIPAANDLTCCTSSVKGTWSEGYYYNAEGCRGYGVITVSTDPDRILLEVKDENGNVRVAYDILPHLSSDFNK